MPPPLKRYDCGPYGLLTRAEIAKVSGVSVRNIELRIACGNRGADLCRPRGAPRDRNLARQPLWPAGPLRGVFTWRIVSAPTEESR